MAGLAHRQLKAVIPNTVSKHGNAEAKGDPL
jgi:hypothetical protein